MKRVERQTIGDYEIRWSTTTPGACTIFGPSTYKKGSYLPPDKTLIAEYKKRGDTPYTQKLFALRGIIHSGELRVSSGKKALGIDTTERVTKKEIDDAVNSYWPKEYIEKLSQGLTTENKTIIGFQAQYPRVYAYLKAKKGNGLSAGKSVAHYGGLRGILEAKQPGLYYLIANRTDTGKRKNEIKKELREQLIKRHKQGDPINSASLRASKNLEDRQLFRRVTRLARQELGKRDYTSMAAKLMSVQKSDIELSRDARNKIAHLNERIVAFALAWAPIVDVNIGNIKFPQQRVEHLSEEKRTFTYGRKIGIADVRIGNWGIEAKSGFTNLSRAYLDRLLEKYSLEDCFWGDGKKMTRVALVLNHPIENHVDSISELEDKGIKVIRQRELEEILAKIIKKLKRNYMKDISDVRPRVFSLDSLLDLNHELAFTPYLLSVANNLNRVVYGTEVLDELIKLGNDHPPF